MTSEKSQKQISNGQKASIEVKRTNFTATPPLQKKQVKMNVVQSCPTLCDSKAYIVHGILQARILEWVAFPSPSQV